MYKFEKYNDKFETIKLTDVNNESFFEVVPERGGIITRFSYKGNDILYLDRETLLDTEKNIRGGIPILFPICGYLADGRYRINNNEYKMRQHGIARLNRWEVLDRNIDKSASITLKFSSNDETKKAYPFDFDVIYTYSLKDGTLSVLQDYINKSNVDMPFYAGFHPYFYIMNKNNIELNINSNQYYDTIDKEIHNYNGKLDFTKPEVNIIFSDASGTSGIFDNERNIKISLYYDSIFKYVVIWSLIGKDFICLEPWMAKPDSMNTGKDVQILKPDENLKATFSISCSINNV
ncbi:aldose epimerase [Thermoanaerobacterium sp. RBIITD]|uniref:aldose epimerase family protein n=1 Tax=Thermoanaerobacterium sp. RBIITD TaxID=1550240 RepID=UPI000BB6F8B4|nr:aldose epimerase [Thermoanaerobacterium sp. RBIITD]SNX53336.1 Galactose mutarotase [Thermoanaerobacterium sp. RBIITD]